MQPFFILLGLLGLSAAGPFFTMTAHMPEHPQLNGKVINARDKSFIIGASTPSTYCGLKDPTQCPASRVTLINENMSYLGAAVPGGQFIYVALDGSISYPSGHSALRPPGSQIGGFYPLEMPTEHNPTPTMLIWQSNDGATGLWACPLSPGSKVTNKAVLKAATAKFVGQGCLPVAGIRIKPAGGSFGAWEYT